MGFMCGMEHVRVPPAANAQNGRVERVHLTNPIVFEWYLRTGLGAKF